MSENEKQPKQLDPLSMAVKAKKEAMYDKVKVSVKTLDTIIWIAGIALGVVVILMILEATGVFKL